MSTPAARRVLVTGANKGIGLATVAAVLDHADDTFALLASRDLRRGAVAVADLIAADPSRAGRVVSIALDVAEETSVAQAVAAVRDMFPGEDRPLYGIVNNAGIGFGDTPMAAVLAVNTYGPHRVFTHFEPLLTRRGGRVVNVASASGPKFLEGCSDSMKAAFTDPAVTWESIVSLLDRCVAIADEGGDFGAAGFGDGDAYGLSKAALNALTIALAREHDGFVINACTPGFIETDLTRPFAERRGVTPLDLGMKSPAEGTRAAMHLLFGDVGNRGWYYGSDAVRSPLDRYRSPGDPPYDGT